MIVFSGWFLYTCIILIYDPDLTFHMCSVVRFSLILLDYTTSHLIDMSYLLSLVILVWLVLSSGLVTSFSMMSLELLQDPNSVCSSFYLSLLL